MTLTFVQEIKSTVKYTYSNTIFKEVIKIKIRVGLIEKNGLTKLTQ